MHYVSTSKGVKMLSQRRFGVEIECGFPGGPNAVRTLLDKEKIKPLSVGADGSGVEVRSPVLKGTKGLDWLKECMQALRENGGYVTLADGLHVHHEGTPGYKLTRNSSIDTITCLRLIHSWKNNNDVLDKFVARRRRTHSYCAKVWKNGEYVKNAADGSYPGKYSDLNLRSLNSSKGTIEIRLHEGTLDFDEADAWIRFGQAMLDLAAKSDQPLPKQKNPEALLNVLLESDDVKQRLLEKAERNGEPTPNAAFLHPAPPRDW